MEGVGGVRPTGWERTNQAVSGTMSDGGAVVAGVTSRTQKQTPRDNKATPSVLFDGIGKQLPEITRSIVLPSLSVLCLDDGQVFFP